jgi:hypothetical protein
MIIIFKKTALAITVMLFSPFMFSQKIDDEATIEKMKKDIREFFVSNGEITKENKLGIGAYEITDGSELGYKKTGIYIIRTVYRTDGADYLFFKNDKEYSIVDFKDLKLIVNKTLTLLKDKPDLELFSYLEAINKWYEGSYLYKKNSSKIKFVKGKSQ